MDFKEKNKHVIPGQKSHQFPGYQAIEKKLSLPSTVLMKVNVKPCHVHLLSKEHEVSFFPNKTWHDTNLTRMPLDENYFAEEPLKS